MDFTSTGLIAQIKRRALIPTSQNLFTDSDLIAMLNEELQNRVIPYILAVREDYFLTYNEYTQNGSTTEIDIPTNAIGNKINQVNIYTASSDDSFFASVPRLTVSQINDYYGGYYIQGSKIKIFPQAITSGQLRIYYYRRPSEIVATSRTAVISTVNTNTSIVCSTNLPANITTGSSIDIVSNEQPWDTIAERTAGTVLNATLDLTDTTDIETGFYVASRGESPFAQIPQDTIPLLIQAVVVRMMEYMGDNNGFQSAILTYAQMESDNRNLITPRVDAQPKKISAHRRLSRYLWK
jgi:hypothetical protein